MGSCTQILKIIFYIFVSLTFFLYVLIVAFTCGFSMGLDIVLVFLLIVTIFGIYAVYCNGKLLVVTFMISYIILLVLLVIFSKVYWSIAMGLIALLICFLIFLQL